jgi:hypothetical protein
MLKIKMFPFTERNVIFHHVYFEFMNVLVLVLITEYLFKVIVGETVTTKLLVCRHSELYMGFGD